MNWFKKGLYLFVVIFLTYVFLKNETVILEDVALYIVSVLVSKAMLDWSE